MCFLDIVSTFNELSINYKRLGDEKKLFFLYKGTGVMFLVLLVFFILYSILEGEPQKQNILGIFKW